MAKTFRDLKVWQKAHKLVLEIYRITNEDQYQQTLGLAEEVSKMLNSWTKSQH